MRSNIYLKAKKAGGVKITFQLPPKNLDEKMLYNILRDYKMLNCEVLVRDENGQLLSVHFFTNIMLTLSSNGRRLHRCDNERPPQIHQMVDMLELYQRKSTLLIHWQASMSTTRSIASV